MKNSDIVETARQRMSEAVDADRENRAHELDDLQKISGLNHWPEDIRREREADGKPCLVFNRFPQFVRQVTGDIRRMNPSIKVVAGDDDATDEVAEIFDGMIRQIEYASDASSIYERAAEQAAASSIGWFRVLTRYESDNSFLQECYIKSIRKPLSVYCDPAAEMPTREDASYIFITQQMRVEDFNNEFPKAKQVDVEIDAETDGLE